jgi:hypothetical protein
VREGKRSFSDVSPIPETTVLDEASVNWSHTKIVNATPMTQTGWASILNDVIGISNRICIRLSKVYRESEHAQKATLQSIHIAAQTRKTGEKWPHFERQFWHVPYWIISKILLRNINYSFKNITVK